MHGSAARARNIGRECFMRPILPTLKFDAVTDTSPNGPALRAARYIVVTYESIAFCHNAVEIP